jgi:hypothetical protein
MSSPTVWPPTFTMSVTEALPLVFDTTGLLLNGQAPANATSGLVALTSSEAFALADAPVISGNFITQIVNGPTELVKPGKYRLTVNFTASPSSALWAMELVIIAVD